MVLQKEIAVEGVREAAVLTKAFVRAADKLGLSNVVLSRIVGLSGPTISRMRRGEYVIEQGAKPFELAALFVRVYRSLDAIVGGDDAVAAKWLLSSNTVLNERPVNLLQSVAGLIGVLQYLDARRAVS